MFIFSTPWLLIVIVVLSEIPEPAFAVTTTVTTSAIIQ